MSLNILWNIVFCIVYVFMTQSFAIKAKIVLLEIFDLISFLVFVTWVVLFIRFFIFNPYTVVGKSMEPFFSQWDFIVVDKITPRLWTIEREDILVFVAQWRTDAYIKRVIGLPGETIKIREWSVYICEDEEQAIEDCIEHKEYYLPDWFVTNTDQCWKDTFTIWAEGYFVLWDNRDHSTDSRCCFGLACHDDANYLVYDKDLIGKVAIKVYPEVRPYW